MNLADIEEMATALESKDLDDALAYSVIGVFNHAMLGNVDGPNCTDRNTCNNNCCSIMIDIPRFLAQKHITDGRLLPADVRRGDAFAWKLNVNDDTGKCVFFSPDLYGCQIYVDDLDARPPQCAIYPAGYTTGAIACKAGAGPWTVKDEATGLACERLMIVYKNYCIAERERVKEEFLADLPTMLATRLASQLESARPSGIAGVKDTWNGMALLNADGTSFSTRIFCKQDCHLEFLDCECMCMQAINACLSFLETALPAFIEAHDLKEEYTFMELKEITK